VKRGKKQSPRGDPAREEHEKQRKTRRNDGRSTSGGKGKRAPGRKTNKRGIVKRIKEKAKNQPEGVKEETQPFWNINTDTAGEGEKDARNLWGTKKSDSERQITKKYRTSTQGGGESSAWGGSSGAGGRAQRHGPRTV